MTSVFNEQTFKNGTKHIRENDFETGEYIQWAKSVPNSKFKMPFGKYEDRTIVEIFIGDPMYLKWLGEKLKGKNIGIRIATFFEELKEWKKK